MPRGEVCGLLLLALLVPALVPAEARAQQADGTARPAPTPAPEAAATPPAPWAPTPVAGSRPQINAGLTVGVAGQGEGTLWDHTYFHGGLRGDVLFGRSSAHDWGVGPLVAISTTHFRDFNAGAGLSVLAPVHEYLPIVLGLGAYARRYEGTHPGLFASLFWGTRSFNYHGNYGLAAGLLVEGRAGLDDTRERTLVLAAHLDAELLVLPVFFLINALR
jgi:hypothetical protein